MQHPTSIAVRRALPVEATILTDIAFAAKRHWGYPAAWIAQWRSALTITPQQIVAHPSYVALAAEPVAVAMLSREGRAFALEHARQNTQEKGPEGESRDAQSPDGRRWRVA